MAIKKGQYDQQGVYYVSYWESSFPAFAVIVVENEDKGEQEFFRDILPNLFDTRPFFCDEDEAREMFLKTCQYHDLNKSQSVFVIRKYNGSFNDLFEHVKQILPKYIEWNKELSMLNNKIYTSY